MAGRAGSPAGVGQLSGEACILLRQVDEVDMGVREHISDYASAPEDWSSDEKNVEFPVSTIEKQWTWQYAMYSII
jgi:hypothetical protein